MPDGLASAELGGLVLERLLGVRTGEARPHGFHFCGVTTTSSVRPECLNAHWFSTLDDARRTIEDWRTDYNDVRPHSSLGEMPPAVFAATHRETAA
jgi:transposase InsO family protein